ncbi:MAG: oxygen-independent coproporphyrinogen III oxidase [Rhodobiaceae bacterium]|nr:oxygen-independent coproporphyrinogen III oxidase [Rhodobiaceae bacterium]MCC0014087.1 oxygen-independent coproporphyrinogen III oxidase [Rhodobiaceae bacterium]MCC0051677.1 oxygen-independent coproporphyrinogen III oxidase [Rhodobiaceae bacterium]MCC0061985.1 oxygen-independent coproporphyrinogen III oxidase [Rhodobiaceae bacterium]
MRQELVESYASAQVPRYTSYPTAAQFSPAVNAEVVAGWAAALSDDARLSLYFHVPFCRSICWYCGCHTKATRKDGPLISYGQTLERELESSALAFAHGGKGPRQVVSIHWGGGTPSMLPADVFQDIVDSMRACYSVSDDAEHAMELDPRLIDEALVAKITGAGINRVSLGVQDFTPRVQSAIGRVQPFEQVASAVDLLNRAGLDEMNFDLIYGLPLQSQADLIRSIDLATSLAPGRIALFGYAHVPWFKTHQRMIDEMVLPGAMERLEMAEAAGERLVALGYRRIGIDHFAREDDKLAIAAENGTLRRNFQGYTTDPADAVIGLGASSISSFPTGFAQNAPATAEWARAVNAGHFATVRGVATTQADRFRSALIEALMCNLSVDVSAIAASHGMKATSLGDWRKRIDALADDGLARRDGDTVMVPEEARAFTRVVAAVFDAYLEPEARKHSVAV